MLEIKKQPPLFEVDGRAVLTGFVKGKKEAKYAIIAVRDPLGFKEDAADVIAAQMTDVTEITRNTMFTIVKGKYKGVEMLICSTGSGAPETEIVIMDMIQYAGVDTFLRVGTSGTQQESVDVGDIILASGIVRTEGLTKDYIAPEFPAVSDYALLVSLIEASENNNKKYHVGITRSTDSIYSGQGREVMGYLPMPQDRIVDYWVNAGVLNVERESSAIVTLPLLFGLRGGAVNVACNSSITQKVGVSQGIDDAIFVGLEGLALLAEKDDILAKNGKKYWFPGLK